MDIRKYIDTKKEGRVYELKNQNVIAMDTFSCKNSSGFSNFVQLKLKGNDSLSLHASLSSFAYVKTRALTDDSFHLQLVVVIFDLVSSVFQRIFKETSCHTLAFTSR